MRLNRRSRLMLRLHGAVFVVLLGAFVTLLALLATRYHLQWDWTAGARNTLSAPSRKLLHRLHGPVTATVYAREQPALREPIAELLARYRREKADFHVRFVDPDKQPDVVRAKGITSNGEIIVHYDGHSAHVTTPSERAITSALQRLALRGKRWIVYLTGHGERDLLGKRNFDLGRFGAHLRAQGYTVQPLDLAQAGAVPTNTAVLVLSMPEVDLAPGEAHLLLDYLKHGGNLLWLGDPDPLHGLQPIADWLHLEFLPGVVVDPASRLYGVDDPTFVVLSKYPPHPITRGFDLRTLLPHAAGLKAEPGGPLAATPLLRTESRAWVETGPLTGTVTFDTGVDTPGPVDVGLAFTRPRPGDKGAAAGEQRVVVTGDGDFLSNAFLGNGGNLDLGLSIVNWLAGEDQLVAIPTHRAPDAQLDLSHGAMLALALGTLFGLPLLLLAAGFTIHLRRRRR